MLSVSGTKITEKLPGTKSIIEPKIVFWGAFRILLRAKAAQADKFCPKCGHLGKFKTIITKKMKNFTFFP